MNFDLTKICPEFEEYYKNLPGPNFERPSKECREKLEAEAAKLGFFVNWSELDKFYDEKEKI